MPVAVRSLLALALLTPGCGVTSSVAPPRPEHEHPDAGAEGAPEQFIDDEPAHEPGDGTPDAGNENGTARDAGTGTPDASWGEHEHGGGGGGSGDAGRSATGIYSCRSESHEDGELVVYCAEWTGPEADDLLTFCDSPGTDYQTAPCAVEGSVGACAYAVSEGLTIRNVWYADPASGESNCKSSGGTWQPPPWP